MAGRDFSDPETQDIIAGLAYDVVERDGKIAIKIPSKVAYLYLSPEEIMAEILKKLKTMAEVYLNKTISSAIVAVPSPANEAQRQATKDAGRVAGLDVLHTWSEAEAAGIAYGIDTPLHPHPIREIDQFVIFQIEDKESKLALVAIGYGGGVTAVISDKNLNGIDLEKRSWSWWGKVSPGTRACGLVKKLLESAGMEKSQIEGLIITGNPEHIRSFQPSLETCLGRKARSLHSPSKGLVKSDEAIVRGMAKQGCHWSTPERGCTWLSQGEWAPLSLGIETSGGMFTPLISKYAMLPTHRTSTFTTTRDSQDKVKIRIFEGERPLASKNRALGTVELSNIPRKLRGESIIEVEFELNWSHRLTVIVRERESGKEDRFDLTIEHSNEEPDEVEEVVKEAEKYREEDEVLLKSIKLEMEDGQGLGEFSIEAKEFPPPPPEIRSGWEWFFGGFRDAADWLERHRQPALYFYFF